MLDPESRKKILEEGFDPNIRHYGLVEKYDRHMWTGQGLGKGLVRVYRPYNDKKWKTISVYGHNVKGNPFERFQAVLNIGDMVGMNLVIGPNGITGNKILVVRTKQRDVDVERDVTKALNILKERGGYLSPFSTKISEEEEEFYLGYISAYPQLPNAPEVLPKIEKAPKL